MSALIYFAKVSSVHRLSHNSPSHPSPLWEFTHSLQNEDSSFKGFFFYVGSATCNFEEMGQQSN